MVSRNLGLDFDMVYSTRAAAAGSDSPTVAKTGGFGPEFQNPVGGGGLQ